MDVEFLIPSSKDDLLNRSRVNQYCVDEVLTLRQIPTALQEYRAACRGKPTCVVEHFDTLFSILCLQKDVDSAVKEETWQMLLKGCQTYLKSLTTFLDETDLDKEERTNHLNSTKMALYLLCQYMELFDLQAIRPAAVMTGKGRGKKPKSVEDSQMDWDFERQQGLTVLLSFIQLSLNKLWDPPVAEEEFVSLVSTCCYKLLENPSIAKAKESQDLIAHIIGNLIRRYNHGLGASLKMDQLLKHFEFLTTPLAYMVAVMVKDHGCKTTVTDILREIGCADPKEASRDSAAAKAYANFLVELAQAMPSIVLPCMPLLVGHLEGESYTLRNGVLGMMGEIVVKHLAKEELDDKMKATRDGFLDRLQDHIHDVNAFVRSKVLQIWMTIVTEQCLPLLRQESLMALVVGRLSDKSSIVRRHALQLVTALLKSNPFAAKLSVEDLQKNYEKEQAVLEEMTPEPMTPLTPMATDDETDQAWAEIETDLSQFVKEAESLSGETGSLMEEEETSDSALQRIVSHLEKKEFAAAIALIALAMEAFPDLPVFSLLNKPKDDDEEEAMSEEDDDDDDGGEKSKENKQKILQALKEVFFWVKRPLPPHTPDSSAVDAPADDSNSDLAKQRMLVQYLKNSLMFASQVQQCIPVICQLLGSKNTSDVLEAIQFFVTAIEFGVSAAIVGVRRMLVLVWSQEATVRDAVVAAYRTLYLEPKEKSQRSPAVSIVSSLSALVAGSTFGDLASLEALVSEFVKSGQIGPQVIQALWERFTFKSGGVSSQDSRCAVNLIAMCAAAEPDIVKSNIDVLVQEGLGPCAENDFLLAQGTCQALLKLVVKNKEKGKRPPAPFRLPHDHEMFTRLKVILMKGLRDTTNQYWIPLGDQAVTMIYKLAETPDIVCADMLKDFVQDLINLCEEISQSSGDAGDGSDSSPALSCVLARVLSIAGQVAFRQSVFMEVDILCEMKRRQSIMEEGKEGGKAAGRRKSKAADSSKASNNEAELEEDMALAGASAEDNEAEFVRKICEKELLNGENFLAGFCPLLVGVCSNSAKFADLELQTAASLALARFLIVSSEFCEAQLQLLFTLLEKSPSPVIRANLIIALGDLTVRFPNLIEPWTSHLYARLRDSSPLVRKTTLQVLSHLILNDMVKVKGQISELATCIVDNDDRIAGLAKLFFHELAKKSNSMYNMPDIISRLSDPDIGVEEQNFQTIIKFIFSHIEKSKHCESLAEKLCHRFRATRTERQVRDLSFCLSQLSYTEKGIGKLLANFACFADKLVDNEVYGHFSQIISKSRQFIKQEAKAALEEFEDKVNAAHTKGMEDGETAERVTATAKSVCVLPGGKARKGKTPGRKTKKANKENIEEEDEENSDSANLENESPLKAKRGVKGRGKLTKPRFTLDSDDENDDDLFDMGKEGEKEYDLDTDDSKLTRPSCRRSRKGKVPLSPMVTPA